MAATVDPSPAYEAARRRRWRELLYTLWPVVGLAVLALFSHDGPEPDVLATIVLVVLPLSARHSWPLATLIVISIGVLLTISESPVAPWVEVGSISLAAFTVGERASDRTRSALVVIAIAAIMVIVALGTRTIEGVLLPSMFLVLPWLLGDVVRGRRIDAARRVEALEQSLHERASRLQAAAAEERRHMARELHDVLAHAVSVMVIQAGAARQVLRSSPAHAEQSMRTVESTGREAMTELRRFLGALSEDEAPSLAPQPGIAELSTLVARVREAGLPASLEVIGAPQAVPASLEVTGYRIIQEALTNALRYARQAATLVRLSWESDQLRIEVIDEGPATSVDDEDIGRGLVGMRERAALAGGRLEAGPRSGRGYAVRAWLPLTPEPASLEPEAL
jgi:signal transduction histidine kinase